MYECPTESSTPGPGPSGSSPAQSEDSQETGPGPSMLITAPSTTAAETTESSTLEPGPSGSSPAGSEETQETGPGPSMLITAPSTTAAETIESSIPGRGPPGSSPAGSEQSQATGPGPSMLITTPSTTAAETTESSTPGPGPCGLSPAGSNVSVVLNESQNMSISELMPTPKITKKQGKSNRKSLNYTANRVTKQLFVEYGKVNKLVQNEAGCNSPKLARKRKLTDQCDKDNGKCKVNHAKSAAAKKDSGSKIDNKVTTEGKKLKLKHAKQMKIKLVRNKQHETVAHDDDDDSWYCFVCKTDNQLSMTKCVHCGMWLHNECVGLDSDVELDEPFLCPDCDD